MVVALSTQSTLRTIIVLLFAFGASEVLTLHVEMFVEKIKVAWQASPAERNEVTARVARPLSKKVVSVPTERRTQ